MRGITSACVNRTAHTGKRATVRDRPPCRFVAEVWRPTDNSGRSCCQLTQPDERRAATFSPTASRLLTWRARRRSTSIRPGFTCVSLV